MSKRNVLTIHVIKPFTVFFFSHTSLLLQDPAMHGLSWARVGGAAHSLWMTRVGRRHNLTCENQRQLNNIFLPRSGKGVSTRPSRYDPPHALPDTPHSRCRPSSVMRGRSVTLISAVPLPDRFLPAHGIERFPACDGLL